MSGVSLKGWLVISAMVIAGAALEYWWVAGFERSDQRLGRKRKAVLGALLITVAVAGLSYGFIRFYHP